MLVKLIDAFVGNLAFPALILSAGVLVLLSNRDAFEVDTKFREDIDPATGAAQRKWQWKYMSDRAENARLEILHLIRVLRFAATLMIVVSVCFFALGGFMGITGWLGYAGLSHRVEADPTIGLIFRHGLGIVFILIGPILLFRLMRVVSNIIEARASPTARKPAGWTPY